VKTFTWRIKTKEKIIKPCGQLREKYFDYFAFNIVDYGINCGWLRSGAHRRALAQTIGNARGLDINSPLSAEAYTQDRQFHRHQQHDDLNSARGLDNNFASDRDCDSTTTTLLRHHRLRTPTTPHPTKAKFSSSKNRLSFTFATPDTRGLRHE
jgi:hypothetical protein